MKKLLLSGLAIAAFLSVNAQEVIPCHTMENMEIMMQNDPSLREQFASWQSNMKKLNEIADNNKDLQVQGGLRIIPVVFHIMHIGGNENISKAQILDQMVILNKDFRRLNADTNNTPLAFRPVAADCNIEFRLAQKDPNGNCTDGIIRKYTPLTVNAKDNIKALSYWQNTKYFNIWVVKSIDANGSPGVILGYAQFPGFGSPLTDGVVLRHDVVGSIGTAASGPFGTDDGRTLSHEAGHWLGLRHIWGDQNCGDDFVADTPEHWDANFGCPTFPHNVNSNCAPGPNGEMFTNYMDYTDGNCKNMFTLGQSANIDLILASTRLNIWSAANLIFTGTDGSPAVLCAPIADFYPGAPLMICAGDSVLFDDVSYNGQVTSRNWTFTGGSPATSTDSIKYITYSTPGVYSVTLTVSNAAGTNTSTKTNWIIVSPTTAQYNIWNYFEGFDPSLSSDWFVFNKGGDAVTWAHTTLASYWGGGSVRLPNAVTSRGQVDDLVSPSINMTAVNTPKIYFYVAFAQHGSTDADALRVFVSTTCGENWTQRFIKSGSTLKTVNPQSGNFVPTSNTQWRMETVTLTTYAASPNLRFKFEFTSDGGNYIYLDHINLTGTLSSEELEKNPFELNIFPSPTEGFSSIVFNAGDGADLRIAVKDIAGRELLELGNGNFTGDSYVTFDANQFAPGVYFITLENKGSVVTKKFIIQ